MKLVFSQYPVYSLESVSSEDKEGKREGMVGKEEKEDSSERLWEGSGV